MAVFEFNFGERKYHFELKSKINVLAGLSGSGKSALCADILNANNIYNTGITVIQDYGVDLSLYEGSGLLVIDESVLNKYITNKSVKMLDKCFTHLLIITRDSLKSLSYNYKDIFYITVVNNVRTLERLYKDYNNLYFSPEYIEDNGSGLKYFKQYYSDIKSTKGKDNIRKLPTGSKIIADGCAIGSSIRLLENKYYLFLPESFEWLLVRKTPVVPSVEDSWKPEELYYNIAHQYLGCTKNKLTSVCKSRKYIQDFEITDDVLKSYLSAYNQHCSIEELRKLIYEVRGDYDTDTVIKIAIVMSTLNKLD